MWTIEGLEYHQSGILHYGKSMDCSDLQSWYKWSEKTEMSGFADIPAPCAHKQVLLRRLPLWQWGQYSILKYSNSSQEMGARGKHILIPYLFDLVVILKFTILRFQPMKSKYWQDLVYLFPSVIITIHWKMLQQLNLVQTISASWSSEILSISPNLLHLFASLTSLKSSTIRQK